VILNVSTLILSTTEPKRLRIPSLNNPDPIPPRTNPRPFVLSTQHPRTYRGSWSSCYAVERFHNSAPPPSNSAQNKPVPARSAHSNIHEPIQACSYQSRLSNMHEREGVHVLAPPLQSTLRSPCDASPTQRKRVRFVIGDGEGRNEGQGMNYSNSIPRKPRRSQMQALYTPIPFHEGPTQVCPRHHSRSTEAHKREPHDTPALSLICSQC